MILFALRIFSLETTSKCPSQILPLYLRSMDQLDTQYHYLVVSHLSVFPLNNLFLLNLLTSLITPTAIPATGLSLTTPDQFSNLCSGPASCVAWAPLACESQFARVSCCGMTSHNTCVYIQAKTAYELVMPSNHLILCCPLSPLAFNLSQHQGLFQ